MVPKAYSAPNLARRLQEAVESYDLPNRPEFSVLEAISAQTQFDSIDVHGNSIVEVGSDMFAPATVYVTLRYGLNDPEGEVSWTDSYPARIKFVLEDNEVVVQSIDVDTSSFYGESNE